MPRQVIVSKYFSKRVMDDSLNDFRETKAKCVGPKPNNKPKPKTKQRKKVKGQKDIRTLINSKKSEYQTFTEDFNNVCTKIGIDIDPQDLQLAIALSKSAQEHNQIEAGPSQLTKSQSSQARTNQIRRTLQEYGFKVPDTKINSEGNRRLRKSKKSYKLLLISDEERHQNIYDRFSQVLFQNPDNCFESDPSNCVNIGLYYLSTNIPYESIRRNEIFHIPGLLQKVSQSIGSMLKDWSNIPGRPKSPVLNRDNYISILNINCTQTELDTILSGSLKATNDILNAKVNPNSSLDNSVIVEEQLETYNIKQTEHNIDIIEAQEGQQDNCITQNIQNSRDSIQTNMISLHTKRGLSPDIFGDDASSIIDNSIIDNCLNNQNNTLQVVDLTKQVEHDVILKEPILSQGNNRTKRKTNDFMDLTECVPVTIDKNLTNYEPFKPQESRLINDCMEITECINPSQLNTSQKHNLDSESADVSPLDIPSEVTDNNKISKDNIVSLDLTQSSNSDEDLPEVEIRRKRNSSCETIIIDYDIYSKSENSIIELNEEDDININNVDNAITDLTQHFENDNLSLDKIVDRPKELQDFNDIDLTQSSGSSPNITQVNQSQDSAPQICNSLGKNGDVSIDYDEICVTETNEFGSDEQFDDIRSKYSQCSSKTSPSKNCTNLTSNCSTSEVFQLSDRELNYSIHKSNIDNFQLGGISVVDNITDTQSKLGCVEKSVSNQSLSDSHLPSASFNNAVNSKHTEAYIKVNKSICATPIRTTIREDKVSVETPSNGEYVVKTGDVTPMLDYAAMTSPERNLELEKYGLKPFKRKRAIKLLTHLYNQTHPIIEYCSGESVPKRPKLASPKKVLKSPIKNVCPSKSIHKQDLNPGSGKENEICYVETKDIPDIKDIECPPEDWIFQKRAKAKVHSCKVPLHVAFHNYVSCRRGLREAILRYQPVNIDMIHKDLVSYGYRYNPKDLLKFLDKKCITVKTADNNARNCRK